MDSTSALKDAARLLAESSDYRRGHVNTPESLFADDILEEMGEAYLGVLHKLCQRA